MCSTAYPSPQDPLPSGTAGSGKHHWLYVFSLLFQNIFWKIFFLCSLFPDDDSLLLQREVGTQHTGFSPWRLPDLPRTAVCGSSRSIQLRLNAKCIFPLCRAHRAWASALHHSKTPEPLGKRGLGSGQSGGHLYQKAVSEPCFLEQSGRYGLLCCASQTRQRRGC